MIAGLDLSLQSTGVAQIYAGGAASCYSITSQGHRADTYDQRSARLRDVAGRIINGLYSRPQLAVVEAPSYGSTGGSAFDRAGLWWLVVSRLHRLDVPVAMVAPQTRTKYATGNGRAGKREVRAAAAALFPDTHISNYDEADSLILAHIGATQAGYPVDSLQRHHDALKAVHFPTKGLAPWPN